MKKDIHPKYGPAVVQCACGNVVETRSTKERIQVEICSACHPFFTGRQKLIDTAGRIDRFKKKFGDKITAAPSPKKPKAKPVTLVNTKKAPQASASFKEKLQKAKEK